MSETKVIYDLGFVNNGGTVCVPIQNVTNNSGVYADDVVLKLKKTPEGLVYSSSNLDRGSFDPNTNIWTIGLLAPGESIQGLLCYTVPDSKYKSFVFTFQAFSSEYCNSCDDGPVHTVTLKVIPCSVLADCGAFSVADEPYDNDADAAVGGVAIGSYYVLSDSNTYGLPAGDLRQRVA